jgi:GNAT superfamily N-acetyltransferase
MIKTNLDIQTDVPNNFYQVKHDANKRIFVTCPNSVKPSINCNMLIESLKNMLKKSREYSQNKIFDYFTTHDGAKEYLIEELTNDGKNHKKEHWLQINEDTNDIISHAELTHNNFDNKPSFFISTLLVCEKYRGQGKCLELLKFIENYAVECGKEQLVLGVYARNEKAFNIYTKYGFKVFQRSL